MTDDTTAAPAAAVEKPVFDQDKCVNCLMCWIYCGQDAVRLENGRVVGIDYQLCSGCGRCVEVCSRRHARTWAVQD